MWMGEGKDNGRREKERRGMEMERKWRGKVENERTQNATLPPFLNTRFASGHILFQSNQWHACAMIHTQIVIRITFLNCTNWKGRDRKVERERAR